MVLYNFFWGFGRTMENVLSIFDDQYILTSFFNTGVLLLGFFGLFYWLRLQIKFNQAAKDNPNQIK